MLTDAQATKFLEIQDSTRNTNTEILVLENPFDAEHYKIATNRSINGYDIFSNMFHAQVQIDLRVKFNNVRSHQKHKLAWQDLQFELFELSHYNLRIPNACVACFYNNLLQDG